MQNALPPAAAGKTCARCALPATDDRKLYACQPCSTVLYCGKACQRADWDRHRLHCRLHGKHTAVLVDEPLDGNEQRFMEAFRRLDTGGLEPAPESPNTISPELADPHCSLEDRRAGVARAVKAYRKRGKACERRGDDYGAAFAAHGCATACIQGFQWAEARQHMDRSFGFWGRWAAAHPVGENEVKDVLHMREAQKRSMDKNSAGIDCNLGGVTVRTMSADLAAAVKVAAPSLAGGRVLGEQLLALAAQVLRMHALWREHVEVGGARWEHGVAAACLDRDVMVAGLAFLVVPALGERDDLAARRDRTEYDACVLSLLDVVDERLGHGLALVATHGDALGAAVVSKAHATLRSWSQLSAAVRESVTCEAAREPRARLNTARHALA